MERERGISYSVHVALTVALFAVVLLVTFFGAILHANAAPIEVDEGGGISNNIFNADYMRLPDDEDAHYIIDLSETTEEEQENNAAENFMDSVQNFNPIGNTVENTAMEFINIMTNLGLQWNMMLTNMMIGVLNFGFETEIIDSWIDGMDGMVTRMAGIAGTTVTGGLFGSLLGFAVIASALAAVYQLLLRRAALGSMQTLAKTIVSLALAFALFANFGPLMKGMNEISTDISATMLTGTANTVSGDNRTPEQIRQEVSANLWNEFIGRPYMILQYGSDDVEAIGQDRVTELLAMPAGEDRTKYVDEVEVGERGNSTMTYASVIERFAFTFVYSTINALVSLPIYALALALIIFQLWFLMMAFIAPFILIQSAFPGQFPVLKRYAVELMYPLFCKLLATVATLFIFTLGFMIYSIDINVGISRYFISAFMQFALFGVFFFGRKRIAGIMSAGSRGPFEALRYDINGLKVSVNEAANKLGGVGKAVAGVGLAAVTGGTGAAVVAGATEVGKAMAKDGEPERDQAPNDSSMSRPMISTNEQTEPDHAPEERETASANSQPVTSIVEEAKQERVEQPVAKIAENQPSTKAPEVTEEPEIDLSKPLARIEEVEEEPKTELRVKDKKAGEEDVQ